MRFTWELNYFVAQNSWLFFDFNVSFEVRVAVRKRKKRATLYCLFCLKGIFLRFVSSQCIVYWILSEYTYFYISKNIIHFYYTIITSLQCILNVVNFVLSRKYKHLNYVNMDKTPIKKIKSQMQNVVKVKIEWCNFLVEGKNKISCL